MYKAGRAPEWNHEKSVKNDRGLRPAFSSAKSTTKGRQEISQMSSEPLYPSRKSRLCMPVADPGLGGVLVHQWQLSLGSHEVEKELDDGDPSTFRPLHCRLVTQSLQPAGKGLHIAPAVLGPQTLS